MLITMKQTTNRKRYILYLWIGLAWFILWEITIVAQHPDTFFQRTINEIWRDLYLVALNCVLHELVVPFSYFQLSFVFNSILDKHHPLPARSFRWY